MSVSARRNDLGAQEWPDLRRLLASALGSCCALTDSPLGYIDLVDGDGRREVAVVSGLEAGDDLMRGHRGAAVRAALAAPVMARRRTAIVNDVSRDGRDVTLTPDLPIHAAMSVPSLCDGAIVGIIVVANRPHGYNARDRDVVAAVTEPLAAAIVGSQLHERELQAQRDMQRLNVEAAERAALDERRRLARDLHDSTSQALYGIALAAQAVRRSTRSGASMSELLEPLDFIAHLADAAQADMRSLLFGLRPESLAEEGLGSGLQRLATAARARHALNVDVVCDPLPAVRLETLEALYRVAAEAVNNAIRHAAAGSLRIECTAVGASVQLRIIDDGSGFDAAADHSGHIGIRGMRERAHATGMQLTIDSRVGGGTEVRVRTRAVPRATARSIPWGG